MEYVLTLGLFLTKMEDIKIEYTHSYTLITHSYMVTNHCTSTHLIAHTTHGST